MHRNGEPAPPPASGESTAAASSTLSDEHAQLVREVTARADALIQETDADRWPEHQLQELVNYLQLEVLRQIVDEEWLLFRAARVAPEGLARLRSEHLELRMSIDVLTQAAAGQKMSPAQLAATTHHLLGQVAAHVADEEQVLAAAQTDVPATASLGSQPHEWYELTEGPVIDLDKLPGEQGADAVLARLLRLRPGEQVEMQASVDPGPMWQRVIRTDPGAYRINPLERGPSRWRVELVRNPDPWTPHPMA